MRSARARPRGAPVKHSTRTRIRHLYFVWQVPVDEIAAELRLRPRTVRRALVIRGGARRAPDAPSIPPTPSQEEPS